MSETAAAPRPAEDLRYPIGKWDRQPAREAAEVVAAIDAIDEAPALLRAAVAGLDEARLDTPYRPGGWTVRQLVHHVADSHLNAYVRCKLALTEDRPAIKTYEEKLWAELPEARSAPVEVSLKLLEGLHERWVLVLRALGEDELDRPYVHPEMGDMPLRAVLGMYAWHCRHHVAHVTALRRRQGW
ncbi:MAG TPA: putative metal-dependent hydrolase [Thermoanaerobaculia bacterium]|nr:putative metal-dependent hydrolase [Thermoanaerobaculia bacterium]